MGNKYFTPIEICLRIIFQKTTQVFHILNYRYYPLGRYLTWKFTVNARDKYIKCIVSPFCIIMFYYRSGTLTVNVSKEGPHANINNIVLLFSISIAIMEYT